jgi:hypothetical protein
MEKIHYDGVNQIPNIPATYTIPQSTGVSITPASNFIVGMPVRFNTDDADGTVSHLVNNHVYWITSTAGTTGLSKYFNSNALPCAIPGSGAHTLTLAQIPQQIDEASVLRRNNTYPTPQQGSLAYGDVIGTKSTLYYHNGSGYEMVKLGYPGGNGYYNNGATFHSTYTGWCHSNGSYKIITASNQIKLIFNWIEVVEDITGSRDIVQGVRNTPVTDYNILITNSGSTGLNTIDTGTILADTSYWVYLVYNPESKVYGGILSTDSNKPEFPTDSSTATQYRFYQRLGWIRTDTTGAFLPSLQVDDHFCFLSLPTPTFSLSYYGAGTSPDIDIIDIGETQSLNYPRAEYLDRIHWILGFNGTGLNGADGINGLGPSVYSTVASARTYYWNGQPINTTVSTKGEDSDGIVRQVCQIYNDFPVSKNVNRIFNVSQPTATDYINCSGYIYGFVFSGDVTL